MTSRKAPESSRETFYTYIYNSYYIGRNMSLGGITRLLKLPKSTLSNNFKKFNLKLRSNTVASQIANQNLSDKEIRTIHENYYVGKCMTINEISSDFNISSSQFFARCTQQGLEFRELGEAREVFWDKRENRLKKYIYEYKSGEKTVAQIASELDMSTSQVYRNFKKLGVDLTRSPGALLSEPEEKQIVAAYKRGQSPREIAADYGVSDRKVRKILQSNETNTRGLGEAINLSLQRGKVNGRKSVNAGLKLAFLNKITPELAWFLGAVFSDGSIGYNYGPRKRTCSFSLASKDKDFAEKLGELVGIKPSESHALSNCDSHMYTLRSTNKEFVDALSSLGVRQNKAAIVELPHHVPNEMIRHFIRGYFEGDGCIHINSKGRLRFSLSSKSAKIMTQIARILYQQAGIGIVGKRYSNKHINSSNCPFLSVYEVQEACTDLIMYKIESSSQDALLKLFHYLYYDVDQAYRMDRKYSIFHRGIG